MKRQDPWEIYQSETKRKQWICVPVVQGIVACCVLAGVCIVSATNTQLAKISGQVVWQATHMAGDFSQVWSWLDSAKQRLTDGVWFDSVRAVTARPAVSLRNLEKPIEGVIVSEFGEGQDGIWHEEIEWEVPQGSKVKASSAGKVIDLVRDEAADNRTLIVQSGSMTLRYGYLSETWVSVGDMVARGQIIGCSGKKDGKYPRLSLAIRERGKAIDPLSRMSDTRDNLK